MRNRLVLIFLAFCILFVQADVSGQASGSSAQGEPLQIQSKSFGLFGYAFSSTSINSELNLVVVLHGDAPPPYENPSYHYRFAAKVAAENKNVLAVGLLRPGYTDPTGNHSDKSGPLVIRKR
ncbi:hypothetical protein D3OALGA1CA_4717 [Olavius algarvensis associated proteobacterium Delta 3]|nr:hypothetical protein D3OALGB2SA_1991 [Olavius algarvensis associated proteobacterium Delta 3]CAB5155789.1 hypothetical protein D3OALGA1CA_4717 [Olavius algarvensis associated proteobacterium Delta 3]